MAKKLFSPTLAETAFGQRQDNPVKSMLAGFTGFAVAVTLILATAIPVEAHRTEVNRAGTCAVLLETATATCTSD